MKVVHNSEKMQRHFLDSHQVHNLKRDRLTYQTTPIPKFLLSRCKYLIQLLKEIRKRSLEELQTQHSERRLKNQKSISTDHNNNNKRKGLIVVQVHIQLARISSLALKIQVIHTKEMLKHSLEDLLRVINNNKNLNTMQVLLSIDQKTTQHLHIVKTLRSLLLRTLIPLLKAFPIT